MANITKAVRKDANRLKGGRPTEAEWFRELADKRLEGDDHDPDRKFGVTIEIRMPIGAFDPADPEANCWVSEVLQTARQYGAAEVTGCTKLEKRA